jgi:DNA-binding response OmpR family regulator
VKLLELFVRNRGAVLDRNTIFDACWGESFFPASRTLDQHIAKLRKKIERDPKNPEIIRTVHGVGYRYDG